MVRELAEYEKLLQDCVSTEKQFQTALFGENPVAEALLGELEGEPIAFALFFRNFSTFLGKPGLHLEDGLNYVQIAARDDEIEGNPLL